MRSNAIKKIRLLEYFYLRLKNWSNRFVHQTADVKQAPHFLLCVDENFITPLGGLHKQSEVTAVCFSTGSPHLEAHAGSHCFQKSIKNSLET